MHRPARPARIVLEVQHAVAFGIVIPKYTGFGTYAGPIGIKRPAEARLDLPARFLSGVGFVGTKQASLENCDKFAGRILLPPSTDIQGASTPVADVFLKNAVRGSQGVGLGAIDDRACGALVSRGSIPAEFAGAELHIAVQTKESTAHVENRKILGQAVKGPFQARRIRRGAVSPLKDQPIENDRRLFNQRTTNPVGIVIPGGIRRPSPGVVPFQVASCREM